MSYWNHWPLVYPALPPMPEHINASRRHDQPETVYFFIGIDETSDKGERDGTKDRNEAPNQDEKGFHAWHPNNPLTACKSQPAPYLLPVNNVITM